MFFLISSIIALIFLAYSIANKEKLGISLVHPRIIVELVLFIVFAVIGLHTLC